MRDLIKDKEHLFLIAALFVGGLILFFVLRMLLVPSDFGVYGHFRAGALVDNQQRPAIFAGRAACLTCHEEKGQELVGGKHKIINCEACHGPQGKHADDPSSPKPQRPAVPELCLRCHVENVAKPKGFPSISPPDHNAGLSCTQCHHPHHPQLS